MCSPSRAGGVSGASLAPSILTGVPLTSSRLDTGWTIAGGSRLLFFNVPVTAAWTFELGLMNTYNRGHDVNEPIRLVQLRFGEALIDLLPADGPPPPHGRGVDHICLSIRAKDLEAVAIALRARGVETDGEVKQRRGAWGVGPSLYIRDLDGYQIELKPRD